MLPTLEDLQEQQPQQQQDDESASGQEADRQQAYNRFPVWLALDEVMDPVSCTACFALNRQFCLYRLFCLVLPVPCTRCSDGSGEWAPGCVYVVLRLSVLWCWRVLVLRLSMVSCVGRVCVCVCACEFVRVNVSVFECSRKGVCACIHGMYVCCNTGP